MKMKPYRKNVQREYGKFREQILSLPPEQIADMCSKIYFYKCLYDYFMYNENISDSVIEKMKSNKNLIVECWNVYLKYENLSCNSWDNIDELVKILEMENLQ